MASSYTFTGETPRTYPTYLDVTGDRPKTLDAEPGKTYAIEAAAGQPDGVPVPPDDGLWKAAKTSSTSKKDGDR